MRRSNINVSAIMAPLGAVVVGLAFHWPTGAIVGAAILAFGLCPYDPRSVR